MQGSGKAKCRSSTGSNSIGLRARLLLLVLAAIIPSFALIVYAAIAERDQATENVNDNALNLVRLAAREQNRIITSTRQLLTALTYLPNISGSGVLCGRVLGHLRQAYSYYTNIGIADLRGRIWCSAVPLSKAVNIADREYFRRAVRTRDFAVGDYQIGRVTGIPAINFAYPVRRRHGSIHEIVYAALNLSWFTELATSLRLPHGSTLTVIDSRGTVLARYPDNERWVGKSIAAFPLGKTVLAHHEAGTAEMRSRDGIKRLIAFAPLHKEASGGVYVSVGTPESVAYAVADKVLARNLMWLAAVTVLALAAAWIASEVFVLRRVRALSETAQRLAQGDFTARTGLPHGNEELGHLALHFDDMASALQKVNRALRTLSAGNQALLRATNERALFESMCRIMVDVGGYALAWVGYPEENGASLRPVAQAGFDGGSDALARSIADMRHTSFAHSVKAATTAVRSGDPAVHLLVNDVFTAPEGESASHYASVAALPLHVNDLVVAVLAVYSAEPDAFDHDELSLLSESAGDLALGIAGLRASAEREQASKTIKRLAHYDALTGLPNHVLFDEQLQKAISTDTPRNRPFALMLVDLDRFREINEALGFHQGDQLLKDVGARIRGAVSEHALVARLRGDEFGIFIPTSDVTHAEEAAQAILQAMRAPFALAEITLDVSVSIGIALSPQHGNAAETLMRHVDQATRQAKRSGEPYAFYAAEPQEDVTRRLVLARALRDAIEAGELALYYQPKVDMRSRRVCGAEALVRWFHPRQGLIPPDEFISLAEHTGLIKPLTAWVLETALRQSFAWHQIGISVPIAANLSAWNLREIDLPVKLKQLLRAWNTRAEWLELEITESAIMDDPHRALTTLKKLNKLGISLFIDDFGTGYSSLSYLQRMPVDAVKIDKSFVQHMLTSTDSASIVRATITLAHDLGIKVVAEGVESEAIWNKLSELGCDVAQGYFISKPIPADEFQAWLQKASGYSN